MTGALTKAVVNRLLTLGAILAGFGLVVAGFFLGFGDAVALFLEDPLDAGSAIEQVDLTVTAVFVVLGIVVWQVGKTYAQFQLTSQPAERSGDGGRIDSDVLEEMNDRLTKIETDLEETRRGIQKLQRSEYTAAFDEESTASADREAGARAEDGRRQSTAREAARDADRTTEGRSARTETGEFDFGGSHRSAETAADRATGESDRSSTGDDTVSGDENDPLA